MTAAAQTAEQTAEQTAAAAQATADTQAADEKAKVDADAKAKAGSASSAAKPKGLLVIGAAVVLRTDDGSERYLYRGAPVDPAAFSKDSIKHATATGLIAKAK